MLKLFIPFVLISGIGLGLFLEYTRTDEEAACLSGFIKYALEYSGELPALEKKRRIQVMADYCARKYR